MALTKDQKKAQVAELATKLKEAQSVMFSHYIGLNVSDVSELRSKLRESDAEMKVAKKTLMKLAFKEAGLPDIEAKELDGAVACIFSFQDALSGAQVAYKFSKDHDQVELVGGVFDGKLLTKEEATELAQMPSRDELLATFVGMLKSPLNSFAGMCSSPLGGFARALDQMAEKGGFAEAPAEEAPKEEAAAEPAAEEAPKEEVKADEPAADDAADAPAEEEKPAEEEAPKEEAKTEEADAPSDDSESEDSPKEESDS